jgi:hypothetical protein
MWIYKEERNYIKFTDAKEYSDPRRLDSFHKAAQEGLNLMNETDVSRYITDTFAGVDTVVASGDTFFFYNPDPTVPPDHMFPFVTLVTSDINDTFSDLNRESVFRLNIGVSKQTFQSLFGVPERRAGKKNAAESDDDQSQYDFTAFDQIMPHPVYGKMYWVCILNPSDETFETKVQPLLTEAYQKAVANKS